MCLFIIELMQCNRKSRLDQCLTGDKTLSKVWVESSTAHNSPGPINGILSSSYFTVVSFLTTPFINSCRRSKLGSFNISLVTLETRGRFYWSGVVLKLVGASRTVIIHLARSQIAILANQVVNLRLGTHCATDLQCLAKKRAIWKWTTKIVTRLFLIELKLTWSGFRFNAALIRR